MKLPPEGARWLISLRWLACAAVFGITFVTSSLLHVVANPLPLYLVGCAMVGYNLLFKLSESEPGAESNIERNIFRQVVFDLTALTLLLYFADLPRNPFLFFYVFHMIIASMYLRGRAPYFLAAMAIGMVGLVMLLEFFELIPAFPLKFPSENGRPAAARPALSARRVRRLRLGACGSRSISPPRSAATSIGRTPKSGRRKRCSASANSWRASPIKSPIRWTACKTASSTSARR